MSRKRRDLRKRFVVFCEGETEFNYVNGMRLKQGVEISLKVINMQGGGYTSFLNCIKTQANNNCLAKFIIIDCDRIKTNTGEEAKLKEILEYCRRQNNNGKIPFFLILNNPDFEYVACLHIPGYKGQDARKYIENVLGFKDIENFKAKKDIYEYLNSYKNSYSYKEMLSRLKEKIVENTYAISKNKLEIRIESTKADWNNVSKQGSNINEFFEVIDW